MASLEVLLSRDPILDCIVSELTIADVYALHGICRAFRCLTDYLRKTRLNINIHLERFVADGRRFRERLGQYDGLISGGFALDFFAPGCRRATRLDVVVEKGHRANAFARYLRTEEQYESGEADGEGGDEAHHRDETVGVFPAGTRARETEG